MSKPIRKFALVCERKFATCQEIIEFKLSKENTYDFKKIQIEKYKGITKANTGKHLMCEIDRVTNSFATEQEFLRAIRYYGPIHKLFIGFSSKGFIKNIKPVFGNFELSEELKLVKDDKLCGNIILSKKENLVKMLTEKDGCFANIYLQDDYYKTTTVEAAVREVRAVRRQYKSIPLDSDANFIISTRKEQLLEEFNKYHLYRGLFLAHQEYYKKYVKPTKQEVKVEPVAEIKQEEKVKKLEFKPYEGEQLKFIDN